MPAPRAELIRRRGVLTQHIVQEATLAQAPQHSTQPGARRDAATDGSRALDRDAAAGLENQNVSRPAPPDPSSAHEERTRQPRSDLPQKE